MTDSERLANQLQHEARIAYQASLDDAITPTDAAFDALVVRWQPMIDFVKEGPHVGFREEAESEAGRIN